MLAYVQALINIALLRSGPEDLPGSRFLLGVTFAFYLLAQIPLALIAYGPGSTLVKIIAVSVVLLVTGLWVLLALTGFKSRYLQTLVALLGTSALLSVLSFPFSLWRQATMLSELPPAAPIVVIFAIMLWSIAIDGHILARALSKSFFVGLLVALGYFFLHTTLLFELVPQSLSG